MFENLVNQEAGKLISSSIKNNKLPGAVLFSGLTGSGKLTAALECARVLNCSSEQKIFNCTCPSCRQHKALVCSNVMLLGSRDCFLEIQAAKNTFINAYTEKAAYIDAARYLFLRSIRKLTLRFNEILWNGEKDFNKIGNLVNSINENLEQLDFPRELPEADKLNDICEALVKDSLKLETDFLYDSIPINHIRNLEEWARIKSEKGKKTIIIENVDKMQASARNSLLKILEEPPEDVVFILLTSKKNAVMQTILSRVRVYDFKDRTLEQQKSVISRVFHNNIFNGSINDYLLTFLPVSPDTINEQAVSFVKTIGMRKLPDIDAIVKACGGFNPRIELKLFFNDIAACLKALRGTPQGCEALYEIISLLKKAMDNVTLYNQRVNNMLDILVRDLSSVNIRYGCILNNA